jgi:hypothetical protein
MPDSNIYPLAWAEVEKFESDIGQASVIVTMAGIGGGSQTFIISVEQVSILIGKLRSAANLETPERKKRFKKNAKL